MSGESALVSEGESFLTGRALELYRHSGLIIPVWAPLNWLAHGAPEELSDLACREWGWRVRGAPGRGPSVPWPMRCTSGPGRCRHRPRAPASLPESDGSGARAPRLRGGAASSFVMRPRLPYRWWASGRPAGPALPSGSGRPWGRTTMPSSPRSGSGGGPGEPRGGSLSLPVDWPASKSTARASRDRWIDQWERVDRRARARLT
jgi:hypothetical protein